MLYALVVGLLALASARPDTQQKKDRHLRLIAHHFADCEGTAKLWESGQLQSLESLEKSYGECMGFLRMIEGRLVTLRTNGYWVNKQPVLGDVWLPYKKRFQSEYVAEQCAGLERFMTSCVETDTGFPKVANRPSQYFHLSDCGRAVKGMHPDDRPSVDRYFEKFQITHHLDKFKKKYVACSRLE